MLDLPIPSPGPPGPYGTMAWLRATVSRFADGETHARRRAVAEALLDTLDPEELRARAATVASHNQGLCNSTLAYVPVAVLADAMGLAGDLVEAVRTVAAAYHPGTDAPGADDALALLLEAVPAAEPEVAAQYVALLVQACEATAALVHGALERPLEEVLRETPPVPATKRVAPGGEIVEVPLAGLPFGAGPRRCPGEAHARALAAGVVEGARGAGASAVTIVPAGVFQSARGERGADAVTIVPAGEDAR